MLAFVKFISKGETALGRRILVSSGKGGVGKTTICSGLGKSLAILGASVVIIDADAGLSNLDTLMNIQGRIVFDLSDLMKRKCRIKQALIPDSDFDNLYTIASNKSEIGEELDDAVRFEEITASLTRFFDFVLIDCPAGASNGFKCALSGSDEALVVVTPHTSSLRDADKIISVISATNIPVQIVINRIRGDLVVSHDMLSHSDIQTLFSKKVIGVIPESDFISVYSSINFNIHNDKDCYKSFCMLADNLYNSRSKIFDYKKPYKGVIGYIKRRLKKA